MNEGRDPHIPPHLVVVARQLAERKFNAEIAEALCITPHTTEKYVSELKQLLGAKDRPELCAVCEKLVSFLP
jgi:DNA-binding NarL/FixJ family response regulator